MAGHPKNQIAFASPLKGAAVATLTTLQAKGFQIEFHSHAEAILTHDFPDAIAELCEALDGEDGNRRKSVLQRARQRSG
jgi:hypothetical protein